MPDEKTRSRVKRLRRSRRARGECETNVWLPAETRLAIDRAVNAGEYPSRRLAIAHALEKVFLTKELKTT
jgi:hypothetical protein